MVLNGLDSLTSAKIREMAKDIKLFYPRQERVPEVEKARLPPFMLAFRNVVNETGRLPTQFEIWHEYRLHEEVKPFLDGGRLEAGVRGRLERSFPSLVRDLDFPLYLKEAGFDAFYDFEADWNGGVDAIVRHRNRLWCLHCYVKTLNGEAYREAKNDRHPNDRYFHLDMPLLLDSYQSEKVGDFYFYGKYHVGRLRYWLDKWDNENLQTAGTGKA